MAVTRSLLLQASQNRWLTEQAPKYRFVRRAVSRFMPGETVEAALAAASELQQHSIGAILTYLGENVADRAEAERVTLHYLDVLDRIRTANLDAQASIKLTQLGLDLDSRFALSNVERIVQHAGAGSIVWVDMEASAYVDATLDIYRKARRVYPNIGLCLQAYLFRTEKDLESLLPLGPAIRLVKGAYHEPPDRAFPRKADVDANYIKLAKRLLSMEAKTAGVRAAFATHDRKLIRDIMGYAQASGAEKQSFEIQMLYGIQRGEQLRLAREGWRQRVLISYGENWFPWFMRRLAERPANLLFLLRNLNPA
ncbi:MAG TPA: proline dehydrogenase family protein [Terriglobia bacterium]|nr:proline dehydrogenase family protein [Terriglobia bacterium]